MPSRDFTSEDLFSSRMMSMQSSTHSSQMKTVGPAISLRTSCWLLPQKEQYSVFLESLDVDFVIGLPALSPHGGFEKGPLIPCLRDQDLASVVSGLLILRPYRPV